mmetsp:Transcript_25789/g.89812  ORF Transcript_25789/g.89812 Transcript_25789/m.89812 type:complete len:84 (+) Transcript_25789:677-928(+)
MLRCMAQRRRPVGRSGFAACVRRTTRLTTAPGVLRGKRLRVRRGAEREWRRGAAWHGEAPPVRLSFAATRVSEERTGAGDPTA